MRDRAKYVELTRAALKVESVSLPKDLIVEESELIEVKRGEFDGEPRIFYKCPDNCGGGYHATRAMYQEFVPYGIMYNDGKIDYYFDDNGNKIDGKPVLPWLKSDFLHCYGCKSIWFIRPISIISTIEKEEREFNKLLKRFEGKIPPELTAEQAFELVTSKGCPKEYLEDNLTIEEGIKLEELLDKHAGASRQKSKFKDARIFGE